MRVWRTRHEVVLDNHNGIAYFDTEAPVEGARPVGLPHWTNVGVVWQTWWQDEEVVEDE